MTFTDQVSDGLLEVLSFSGPVIAGNRIGRTIGFPTANLAVAEINPRLYGIYTTTVILESGKQYAGISNLGVKPTIGSDKPLLEVHIFDFQEDIYGAHIYATLHKKLRAEQRFDSVEELKKQLTLDIQRARDLRH